MRHFIFSLTAVVYGNPSRVPVREDDPTVPISPYGSSKLMTEITLRDAGNAHGLRPVILRYFNVAGADPLGGTGQSTRGPPTSSRSRAKPRSVCGRTCTCSAPTIQRRTGPVSATTFMCPISSPRTARNACPQLSRCVPGQIERGCGGYLFDSHGGYLLDDRGVRQHRITPIQDSTTFWIGSRNINQIVAATVGNE